MATDERHRQLVRTELLGHLFVEAGAGTGKTTLLVDRIIAMLDEEVTLASIAAITFTEKAAAELRDRIRTRLVAAGRHHLAAQMDDATITTIHGFARSILATHALAAELPPQFAVLGEVEASIDFDRRFTVFADELLAGGGAADDALRALLVLGGGRAQLATLTRQLAEHRDQLPSRPWPTAPSMPTAGAVIELLGEALALRSGCLHDADTLAAHLDRLAVVHGALIDAGADPVEQLRVLFEAPSLSAGNRGKKTSWIGSVSKDDVVEALRRAAESADAMRIDMGHHVVATIVPVLAEFVFDSAQARRRAGTLQFADLLIEARRLVRDKPHVRQAVSARWPHILVDEFQDTDPVQLDLVTLIASCDDDPAALDWRQRSYGGGALFCVGDPKQSIYRFRGADVSLYLEAAEAFDATAVELFVNFRSVPGVLEWVNAVMAGLFASSRTVQAEYRPLRAARGRGRGTAVEVIGLEVVDADAATVRGLEAQELVTALARLRAEQPSIETASGMSRPVRYQDMAILMPARTNLPAIETALELAGIPYRIESRSLVFSTTEVRTVAMVLKAIDDPGDAIAVVGALRSVAGACSDRDLVDWFRANGRWSPLAPIPDGWNDHPVARSLRLIAELHEARWWLSLDELVHEVIDRFRLRHAAVAYRRPRDRWRRLQLVVDQALAFERAGGRQLRAFVDWLDAQSEQAADAAETVVPDADDDAVRVLTVHAAKGLEFPVVALAGLGASERANSAPVLFDAAGEVLVRLGRKEFGFEHPAYGDALGRHKDLESAEQDRLLYVAATRARDRLLVSLFRGKRPSAAHRLHELIIGQPELWRVHQRSLDLGLAHHSDVSATPEPRAQGALFADRHAAALRAPIDRVLAATSIAKLGETERPDDEPKAPWRRGRAGTSIGRAVHAVLQSIDLRSGEGVIDASELQASAEGISASAGEVATLVRNVLSAPVVVEAASRPHWREVYLAAEITETLVEGFIDLLFERDDGALVIVDHKTDAARSAAEIDQSMNRYRLQGATYAALVGQTMGRRVAEVVFVFARSGSPPTERRIDGLDDAVGEVLARVRSGDVW